MVQYRRRREGKTDYKKRFSLLKSRKPRLVVRKSNKNMNTQVIAYGLNGDNVIASANSRELEGYGWGRAKSNIPSAYLTGYMCGRKAMVKKIKSAVVDLGLQPVTKSSRLFATVKGAIDAGLDIKADEDIFEDNNRLMGEHIKIDKKDIDKIKKEINKKIK